MPETYHQARNGVDKFLHFPKGITSSPPTSSKKESRTTLSERLIKKPRIQEHNSEHNFNNDSNNEVAASNTFKIPAPNAEDLHNDKRGIIQTALLGKGFPRPFYNQESDEYSRRNRPNCGLIKKKHLTTPRNREDRMSDSDDDVKTSEARAFRNISTFLKTPKIDEENAKTTTANDSDDHCQNCKFFSECPPDHSEQVKPLPNTTTMQLPTMPAKPFNISFPPSSPENVIPFLRHHTNAVICKNAFLCLQHLQTQTQAQTLV
jgi:hypothetical protein